MRETRCKARPGAVLCTKDNLTFVVILLTKGTVPDDQLK